MLRFPSIQALPNRIRCNRSLWCRSISIGFVFLLLIGPEVRAQEGNIAFAQLAVNQASKFPFFPIFIDRNEQPYLNLDALMIAMELSIKFEPNLGSAAGLLGDGQTTFNLNIERSTVEVGEITHHVPTGSIRVLEAGVFVLWTELVKWLPIKIEWAVEAYEIRVVTDYALPSTMRKKREFSRLQLLALEAEREGTDLQQRDLPLFDPGMLELNAATSSGSAVNQYQLNLLGVHRFLKGDLEYSVTETEIAGQPAELRDDYVRLKFYDDLGQYQATFGDTFTVFSPLIFPLATFRGVSFFTGGRVLGFGRTAVVGTAPADSEVDLYRSGILVAFTRTDRSGFYEFRDVPLISNATLFEIRIFTPQGRRYTEFKLVSAQEEMIPKGKLSVQGGTGKSRGATNEFEISGAEVRFGLIDDLTLGTYAVKLENFSANTSETIDDLELMGYFFLVRPLDWAILLVEHSQDSYLPGFGTRRNAFLTSTGASIELEQRTYEGEFSPPARGRVTDFGGVALATDLNQFTIRTGLFSINTNLSARQTEYGGGRDSEEWQLSLSKQLFKQVSVSTEFGKERLSDADGFVSEKRSAAITPIYYIDSLTRIEGFVSKTYIEPGAEFNQTRLAYQKIQQIDSPLGYQVVYTTASNAEDVTSASLSYLFFKSLQVVGTVDTQGNWQANFRYNFPFRISRNGVDPLPPDTFGRGGLEGTVFLDENSNGILDPLEYKLPDVRIAAPGISDLTTDEDGKFSGWGVPAKTSVSIGVDALTTDALLVPAKESYKLFVRPGELVQLDIPLVPSGGISGLLTTSKTQFVSPGSGVVMILTTKAGLLVASVPVETDGSFVIEGVPPGEYVLTGDPGDLDQRGLKLVPQDMVFRFPSGPEPVWFEDIVFVIEDRGE